MRLMMRAKTIARAGRTAGAATLALLALRCGPVGNDGPAAGTGSSSGSSGGGSSGGGSSGGGSSGSGSSGGSSSGGSSSGTGPTDSGTDGDPTMSEAGPTMPGLHVSGNVLVDNGKTVRLLGVNHAGTEFECVHTGTTIFDGPTDVSLVTPMQQWGINTVRVPLNEDCWLGINGIAAAVGGTAYQQAIQSFVEMLRSNGMYVIVDLHWNGPGSTLASAQQPMPDADHAEDFWKSVASMFKSDMGVVFDLYNEPYPDQGSSDPGGCLLNGCTLSDWAGFSGSAAAVGMQQLVTDVRGVGAQNVIMVGGWRWANDLSAWLQNEPHDPINNIAASFHNYNNGICNDTGCWAQTVQPVAMQVPVITGELGEFDCADSYVTQYFSWADNLGISYLGWTWNSDFDCATGPSLITAYSGAPTPLGQAFMSHLPTLQ
jgi:endoglucanase